MRRMIDPKQLGGGQQEQKKYYQHMVVLAIDDNSKLGCTIVNENPNKFKSISDIYKACGGGLSGTAVIPVSGYIYMSSTGAVGIADSFYLTTPTGDGYLWYGKTEIETVDGVQKIKITRTTANVYFKLDSDYVLDTKGNQIK